MNKQQKTLPYLSFVVLFFAGIALLLPTSAFAQKDVSKALANLAKAASPQGAKVVIGPGIGLGSTPFNFLSPHLQRAAFNTSPENWKYVPTPASIQPPTTADIAERVVLSDGKTPSTKRHSIVPSAVTILGSPAIVRAGDKKVSDLRQRATAATTSEYLSPMERERWRQDFEVLRRLWIKEEPSDISKLQNYLTHPVPAQTLTYLQEEYANLLKLIEEVNRELMPKIIYSFLRNEGRPFSLEEKKLINENITKVRSKVDVLAKSLNKDPYLLVQKTYWDRVFTTFNPLLKGVMANPLSIFRNDNRIFVDHEFNLHYPDGTRPYLKDSHSLIEGDEDYDEDEDSYASVRAKMQNPPISREDAAREVEELLPYIPENLRIAIINDDLIPIINMRGWCKKGYLGKNATLSEFRDGFPFMESIRKGDRYDLVITDLLVPNGGVAMMEDFRLLDNRAIVIASSKFYPDDGDSYSQQDLFNFGMDGYMWYNSNLNEGMYGYVQYLRQMKLYFDYKKQHGWQR